MYEDEETSTSDTEERLPTYVERLKQEVEEKDKRLREYISAYKEKNWREWWISQASWER